MLVPAYDSITLAALCFPFLSAFFDPLDRLLVCLLRPLYLPMGLFFL